MPELPEVETVRRQLERKVIGKTVRSVEVYHSKTVGHDETIHALLPGKTVSAIDRIGKLLIFSFSDAHDVHLLAHLKMTGQFFYVKNGDVSGGGHSMTEADTRELPNRHTRSAFLFTDGSTLYFNDMRLFGYTKVADAEAVRRARAQFGPEPIDPSFDCAWFVKTLRKRKTTVKAALLDQSFVAGLGNIYVDEALFQAHIRPTRRTDRIRVAEAEQLCQAMQEILTNAIRVGGTTFQHFVDTGGEQGNYTDYLKVFGKQGKPCPRCGTEIKKIRCAGRGTHFCPGCQT